jgi:hypothetical protein
MRFALAAILMTLMIAHGAAAEDTIMVRPIELADEKAVFATVETAAIEPERTQIGGTVAALSVREGDHGERVQVVATVSDEKLALQMVSQTRTDLSIYREPRICSARTSFPRPGWTRPAPPSMSRPTCAMRGWPNAQ